MKYNNDAELIDILDLECIIIFNDSFNGKEHQTEGIKAIHKLKIECYNLHTLITIE